MSKKVLQGLLLSLLFILTSCNPFTTNLYSGIDKFKNPDLSDADALLSVSDEPQFYENLKDDPEAKAQVLETLQELLDDPDASEEKKQEAALMITDVYLKTTETDEIMSNLNTVVGDAVDGEVDFDSGDGGPEVFFRTLFGEPPSPKSASYKELVIMQLGGFLGAVEALEAYGENLQAGYPVPKDVNHGDNATKALMSGMTRSLVYYIDATPQSARINLLADYLATPKVNGVLPARGFEYTIDMDAEFDSPSDLLIDPVTGEDGLQTVVELGGIDLDSLFN